MPMARDAIRLMERDGWRVVRLGDVARESRQRAGEERPEVYSVTKHDGFVRSADYFDRQVFSRDVSGYRLVRRGEFAYATIHLDEGSLGLFESADAGLISPMYTVFEVDGDRVDRTFLFAYLKQPSMIQKYGRLGDGTVHRRKSIRFNSLARLELNMPPLAEQRRVAAVLDAIDAAIERSEAVIAATEELRRSLLHQLLSRGVPGWHSEWREVRGLGGVPACWEVVRLGDVAEVVRGVSWSREQESAVPLDDAMPVVRIGNVQRDGFWMDDTLYIRGVPQANRARGVITERSLVMVGSNGNRDRVGNVFLSDDRVHGCLLASFLIRIDPIGSVSERFLAMVLRSARIQSRITESTAGSTGLKNLSLRWLRDLPFLLPPLSEQQRIATILDSVDSSLEQARAGTDVLRSLKASASEALLSGRVRTTKAMPA